MGTPPAERTKAKFGIRGRMADAIICFKFYRNRLRSLPAVRGQKWWFPIDFDCRSYNRSVLPCCLWWPWAMTVQGHPMSKVIVPIESLWVVSYLTFFESNIVHLTIFEIFDIKYTFFIGAMVRINPTSGFADRNISNFHQKQPVRWHVQRRHLRTFIWRVARELSCQRNVREACVHGYAIDGDVKVHSSERVSPGACTCQIVKCVCELRRQIICITWRLDKSQWLLSAYTARCWSHWMLKMTSIDQVTGPRGIPRTRS